MMMVVVVVMMMMTTTKNKNFDRRLLSTILDSGTRPYMPGKRTLPSFAAPGFRRMKMARATTSTMVAAAAAVVVTSLARGGEGGGPF